MISGLNHITFIVADVDRAFAFYKDILGMQPIMKWDSAAYVKANGLVICLYKGEPKPSGDPSHIALHVDEDNFIPLLSKLDAAQVPRWKQDNQNGLSIYLLDPDGHKLEISCDDPERLTAVQESLYPET